MIKFNELQILQKYLFNRVGYEEFKSAFNECYGVSNDFYLLEKWNMFKLGQLAYIMNFGNEELLDIFQVEMKKIGYKG